MDGKHPLPLPSPMTHYRNVKAARTLPEKLTSSSGPPHPGVGDSWSQLSLKLGEAKSPNASL